MNGIINSVKKWWYANRIQKIKNELEEILEVVKEDDVSKNHLIPKATNLLSKAMHYMLKYISMASPLEIKCIQQVFEENFGESAESTINGYRIDE